MKRTLAIAGLWFCVVARGLSAPATTNNTIIVSWNWAPLDTGGMVVTDYITNVAFQIYSATNVLGPVWTPFVVVYPTNWVFTAPSNFTANIPATNRLQFFKATTVTAGGESPFSNTLPVLPVQQGPNFTGAKGQ